MPHLEVIFAGDQDSYCTCWMNGEAWFTSSDNYNADDAFQLVERWCEQNGGISTMKVYVFRLYDASTGDIPANVNSVESLSAWYLETTGQELTED